MITSYLQNLVNENNHIVARLDTFDVNSITERGEAKELFKRYCELQKELSQWDGLLYNKFICDRNHKHNRERLLILFGDTCCLCGFHVDEILEFHHKVPKHLGGSNKAFNLGYPVCPNCHDLIHLVDKDQKYIDMIVAYFDKCKSRVNIRELLYFMGYGKIE